MTRPSSLMDSRKPTHLILNFFAIGQTYPAELKYSKLVLLAVLVLVLASCSCCCCCCCCCSCSCSSSSSSGLSVLVPFQPCSLQNWSADRPERTSAQGIRTPEGHGPGKHVQISFRHRWVRIEIHAPGGRPGRQPLNVYIIYIYMCVCMYMYVCK